MFIDDRGGIGRSGICEKFDELLSWGSAPPASDDCEDFGGGIT